MRKEYYKNDFTCPLRLLDRDGAEVLVGGHDFTAVFVTGSPAAFHPAVGRQTSRYEASRVGGREVNCKVGPDGRVTAVFDNHRLPPGLLQCELTVLVPDGTYPDGTRRDVFTGPVGVLLSLEQVRGGGDPDGFLRLAYAQGVVPPNVELSPLPFTFSYGGTTPYNLEGVVVYSTHYKRFYRDGVVIPPRERGYNETSESGEVRASTKRLFICGNKHYRFTGRDFVNVETERNPDQRLVRRAPSINAHPGLAYADRGIIRLPQPGCFAGDSIEISLEGLYFKDDESGRLLPLSSFEIFTYTDGVSCDLTVEKEGDKVVVTRTRQDGGQIERGSHLWIDLGEPCSYRGLSYLGVKYDSSGRKIFYRGLRSFPAARRKPDRLILAEEVKKYVRFGGEGRGSKYITFAYSGRGLRMQMQVWAKTGVRYRSIGYGYYDDNGLTHKYQWHWKDADGVRVCRKTALVRARIRSVKGAWSDWCYFHISPFISGGIAESRQKRI